MKAVTAFLTAAVAFTVASSFAATALVGSLMRGMSGRVQPVDLPFFAIVLFERRDDAADFLAERKTWEKMAAVSLFPWTRADVPEVGLTLLGTGASGEISADAFGGETPAGKEACAQDELCTVTPSLPGWRYADAALVRAFAGSSDAVAFGSPGEGSRRKLLDEVTKLPGRYACTVVTERSGQDLAASLSRRVFLPWQAVPIGVLVMSSTAISCVLAVTFLGRKRSLGILKVLGTTTGGLRRLFSLETTIMGGLGIPLGFLIGWPMVLWALGETAVTVWCFPVAAGFGLASLWFGALLPVRLVRNGSCEQLLNNRPVYAMTNPSCAKCGLCGGF